MDKQVDSYFLETALTFGDYENYQGCYLIRRSDKDYIPDSITKSNRQ